MHVYKGLGAGLACCLLLILRDPTLCVIDNEALTSLSAKAVTRPHQAFRSKMLGAYLNMFRTFVAFYVYIKCLLTEVDIKVVLSFLECLVINGCATSMVENYVLAIKAHFVLYDFLCLMYFFMLYVY